jgi:hypothetical protein
MVSGVSEEAGAHCMPALRQFRLNAQFCDDFSRLILRIILSKDLVESKWP